METIKVSFPGLGIEPFDLNKIAFTLFGEIEVRWYGLIITCGIFLAFLYAIWRGKRNENIVADDVIDVGLATVLCGVLGARLYYVLTTLDEYSYDTFIDVIAIWKGGLAIYGGIIGGCLGILGMCLIKKLRWQKLFDMIGPGVVIAQALGRWGNFFNGEAYGYMIEDTTRYYFFNKEFILSSGEGSFFHTIRMGLIPNEDAYLSMRYYHPTFLYESIWNILGFILLNIFYKHKKFDGQIALMYFAWYGFGRMFIEGLRTDSLYIPGTTLRISQCLGLAFFLISATLLTVFLILSYRKKPALAGVAENSEAETSFEPAQEENCEEATEKNTEIITTEENTEPLTQEELNNGDEN